MIKISIIEKGKHVILLVILCQLLITYCSRRLYPDRTFQNIESPAEKRRLSDFLASGTEKELNIRNATSEEIITSARQYLGVPHCMGGTSMKCMDCSGLLVTVFGKHGIRLPHNSEEQARYGKILTGTGNLKKGDLVFFIRSYRTSYFITHSGIYTGDNKFIHTSSSNGVTITSMDDPWWNEKFIFATRVFE
jgi:cell wall-associated NlpC family hydrolase